MVRSQVEQGNFEALGRRGDARRQQLADGIAEVQLPLYGHLRQQQAGERFGDGADLEERIGLGGAVGHHPPYAVFGDPDDDARAAVRGGKVKPPEHGRDIAVHHGREIRDMHRRDRWIESQSRGGSGIVLRERQWPGDTCQSVQKRQREAQRGGHSHHLCQE